MASTSEDLFQVGWVVNAPKKKSSKSNLHYGGSKGKPTYGKGSSALLIQSDDNFNHIFSDSAIVSNLDHQANAASSSSHYLFYPEQSGSGDYNDLQENDQPAGEEELLRTFCSKAQADANLRMQREETFDRLSCPKNVATAGRIAQSVLSDQSYKHLFYKHAEFGLDEEKPAPTRQEQGTRDDALARPRLRHKMSADEKTQLEKFTNQVAFGRSVPVLEPLKDPWLGGGGAFGTRPGKVGASGGSMHMLQQQKPMFYTANGRSLGTSLDPSFADAATADGKQLPAVQGEGAKTGGPCMLYYGEQQVETRWDRLSKPRSRAEKFQFPVFVGATTKDDMALLEHGAGGAVSDEDEPGAKQTKRSASKPSYTNRRPSLPRNQLLAKVPTELRDAVSKLVDHKGKIEPTSLSLSALAGVAPQISSHGQQQASSAVAPSHPNAKKGVQQQGANLLKINSKKNQRKYDEDSSISMSTTVGEPDDSHSFSVSLQQNKEDSSAEVSSWEHCLKSVAHLEQRSRSKRIPLQTIAPAGVDAIGHSPYADPVSKKHGNSSATAAGGITALRGSRAHQLLDTATASRVEELLYLLILVTNKTGNNQILKQRLQHLLLDDVSPLWKKIGRRYPLKLQDGGDGAATTQQALVASFAKHCPFLYEQLAKMAERSLGRAPLTAETVLAVRDNLLKKEFVQTAIAGDETAAQMKPAGGRGAAGTASRTSTKSRSASASAAAPPAAGVPVLSTLQSFGSFGGADTGDEAGEDPFAEISSVFVQEWGEVQERAKKEQKIEKEKKEQANTKKLVQPTPKVVAVEETDPLGLC
mmetsp:Transcript_2988/g.6881  ORF Transcript_2988/g.6881 Transcript_2988/m.6881 type:complete len:812 (-) Transcript_2988:635-3070(-)|eukprot:g4528.t1